jgi:hypothetical protein
MVEQVEETRRKFIQRIPLIVGAAALAPSLLFPENANAVVSTKYEEPIKFPSEEYINYLANESQYPALCNLRFKIPKNKLVVLGVDKGEIDGYFDISMTPEIARVEVDFHHPKESQLIRLMEEKLGDKILYSEYIDQRIPYRGKTTKTKEFDPQAKDIWRLNIPRIVRETLNGTIVNTGVIYDGKKFGSNGEIATPKMYSLFVIKTRDSNYPLIFNGNIESAKLDNIRIYCRMVNNKIIPIELRGNYKINLGGIIPDSIELRGVLQETA